MNKKPSSRSENKLFSIILLLSLLFSSVGVNGVSTVSAETGNSHVDTIPYLGMIFTYPNDWTLQSTSYRDFGFRISSPEISVDPLGRPMSGGYISAYVIPMSINDWAKYISENPASPIAISEYSGIKLSGVESETFEYVEWHFFAYNHHNILRFVSGIDSYDSLIPIADEIVSNIKLTGSYEAETIPQSLQDLSAEAWNYLAILHAFSYGPGKIINDYEASSHTGSLDYGLDICEGVGCSSSNYNDIVYAPTDIKLVLSTNGYGMPTTSRDYHLFEVTYDFGGKLCLAMGHFAITIPNFTVGKTMPRQGQIGRIINYTPSVNHLHMNLYSVPMDQSCGAGNRTAVPFDSTATNLRGQSLDGVDYHIGTSYVGAAVTSHLYGACALPYDASLAQSFNLPSTFLAASEQGCDEGGLPSDNARFIADITVPDNTAMTPGQSFTKTWRMENNGATTWGNGYSWVFTGGDQMGAPSSVSVPTTSPKNTADISVNMTAPNTSGSYTGYWQIKNPQGQLFGDPVWVKISVGGSTSGQWHVEYFNSKDLNNRCYEGYESDTYIFKNWGGSSPVSGCNSDNFSARFTRTFNFSGGSYSYHCQHDDGCRIYIDGQLSLDAWWDSSFTGHDWGGTLSSGSHEVKVEFYDSGGDARLEAFWSGAGYLPTSPSCTSTEWCASYYGNRDLSGTSAINRSEGASDINHDWGDGGIGYGFPTNNFSIRWQRNVNFDSGRYRFHIRVDDGGRLRVNNNLVIDQWKDQGATEYTADLDLSSGIIPISFEYYENGGGAVAQMWWETLQIYYPPSAIFDAWPTSGTVPLTVSFHIVDTSNMTSCSWNYGDGTVNGTTCSPYNDHIYTNPGVYSVTFTTSGPGGSNSSTRSNYITVLNPVPTISSINPTSATAGGATFNLIVNGTNYNNTSKVRWNGSDRTTTFVNSTQLTASIPASDIASAGIANVTVFNPTPGGGTSGQLPFTINKILTTTTITGDSPDPSLVNQGYTVSATVSAASGTPTGTVTVSDGSASCTITLSGGAGSCLLTSTTPGVKTLTASYSGSSNYNSSSNTASHSVNKIPTITSITGDNPDPSVVNQSYVVSVNVTATSGTPTGTVTINEGSVSCTATLSGGSGSCNLSSTTTGIKILTANYSGDGNYSVSSGTANHTVANPNTSTTTTITGDNPDPSLIGQSYTVLVTVSTASGIPTGTVIVSDGTSSCVIALSGASGACSMPSNTAGIKTLTATYSGDSTHGSSSGTASHTVNKIPTITSITGDNPDPSVVNQSYSVSVSVTANSGTPSGTVSISDGDASCTASLSGGSGSCDLISTTTGTKTLTASYSGDIVYSVSSGSASHTVNNPTTNYTLTVNKAGAGFGTVTSTPAGINCGSDCSESYASGTQVTLTATPAAGSTFAGWTGDADCSDGLVTVNANISCTATFNNSNNSPTVSSITRANPNPTNAASVQFTVTFSDSVTGVNTIAPFSDFILTTTGVTGASITVVNGSGNTYTVTVNTGSGNGTIRLDVVDDNSIVDGAGNPLGGVNVGDGNFTNGEVYTITKASTFGDVSFSHPYYDYIEILYANGYTGGCSTSPLMFCPDMVMDRAQSAVFMLRGNFGSGYTPVTPTHFFKDSWSKAVWAEGWAESMYIENLTAGCVTSPLKFCPYDKLTNEQAAVFGLRLKYGMSYMPPPATGTVFADMTNTGYWAISWAEQAYADGLIPGCGVDGVSGKPKFCPKNQVNRGFGAFIIVTAKNLTMP